jgi:hypothetical protein
MKHPTEDSLLESILELSDPAAEKQLQAHLESCSACRESHQRLADEIAQLGSIDPQVANTLYPLPGQFRPRRGRLSSWLKVAALLAGGFLGGYAVSHFSQSEPIRVVPYHHDNRLSQVPLTSPTPCPAEDTAVDLSWLSP